MKRKLGSASGNFVANYHLPILSGLMIGTSYIPFPPWALFFCLTPLFLFWLRPGPTAPRSLKEVLVGGWVTQFILNLIGFHWIAYTASEFGHFPIAGGLAVLVGFAAIAHLYYPIGGALGYWAARRLRVPPMAQLAAVVLGFSLCERLFASIFPWHLGYPWLWAGFPGSQFADVIGFEGLNLVTIAANALIAWAIYRGAPKVKNAWRPVALAIALVVVVNLLGLGRAEPWKIADQELKVLAVQGNIGNFDKYMAELHANFGGPIVQKYLDLSRAGLAAHPDANVMLWPETAFPSYIDRDMLGGGLQNRVRSLVLEQRVPLLLGAYSHATRFGSRPVDDTFNAIFYLNAAALEPLAPYRKTILLVFGETFPFSDYIPYMDKFFPEQGSFAHGSGPSVWPMVFDGKNPTTARLGPQVCYEGLYPWFSAELARNGAEIFVNVTNDSWFWHPFEPNQHLYMTLARAIEFRRPLMRSTNTGITTAITASGEILEKSPIGVEWTGLFTIPYRSNPAHTFYERFDAMWPWILGLAFFATLLGPLAFGRASGVRSTRERNAKSDLA